jgi:hypothetical protein
MLDRVSKQTLNLHRDNRKCQEKISRGKIENIIVPIHVGGDFTPWRWWNVTGKHGKPIDKKFRIHFEEAWPIINGEKKT